MPDVPEKKEGVKLAKPKAEEPEKSEPDVVVPPPDVVPPPPVESKERRAAPTRGTDQAAAPYPCPKCGQIAVLVIVRVKDHDQSFKQKKDVFKGETRCEKCFNKPPSDLILKWGAAPDEVCEIPDQV